MATTLIPDYVKTRVSTDYGITVDDSLVWSALGLARRYTSQILIAKSSSETITEYIQKDITDYRIALKDRYIRSIDSVDIDTNSQSSDWVSEIEIEENGVIYTINTFPAGRYKIVYKAGLDNSQESVSDPYIQNLVRALALLTIALYKDSQQQANIITAEGELDVQAKRCRDQAYQILDGYRGIGAY